MSEAAIQEQPEEIEAGVVGQTTQEQNQGDNDFEFIPPGQISPIDQSKATGPITVSHVADFYQRYPGEALLLETQVNLAQTVDGLTVRISIPDALNIDDYRMVNSPLLPGVTHALDGTTFTWTIAGRHEHGTSFTFQIESTVLQANQDLRIESAASIFPGTKITGSPAARNDVTVQVKAKGDYLRFLPALYERDELMGRFLMLFESFWSPIDGQLDNIWDYLDTSVAPDALLPWLASWFGMTLDQGWPEEKQRELLHSLVHLYRKRGTKEGLKEYLSIYTQCEVEIIEHRANDFVLGLGGRLGAGVALGKGNRPHTFTVKVALPPGNEDESQEERALETESQRRTIEKIIDAEKPAHTGYTLIIESQSE